jgi:hypothetical protein
MLAAAALALTLLPVATPTLAQSPAPSPGAAPDAIALVRATDPRFADLPTLAEQQRQMAARFDWAPVAAASWIALLPTAARTADELTGQGDWLDTGVGRLVEVMLVDGCPAELKEFPTTDPCATRENWLFHIASDGTVITIAQASTTDAP